MTFVATVSAVLHSGATPVFADIESLHEPWLSPAAVADALGPRTRAILTMSYGGHPGATAALAELARDNDVILLEDAAHALGSRLRTRQVGTFGAAGTFSFSANKNLPVGEGGAVLTNDSEIHARMRLLRSHGMRPSSSGDSAPGDFDYDVVMAGHNYRIDEPRAALARRRLSRLEAANAARRSLDRRYRALLKPIEGLVVPLAPGEDHQLAHHLFVVVLDEELDRRVFRAGLAERGVQTSVHYPPVHLFSAYRDGGLRLPLTESFGDRAVTLPLFAHMTERQQDQVVGAVEESVSLARRR
jgi:dTDP-4-amino-4,6-dideoxygalactose transaminase